MKAKQNKETFSNIIEELKLLHKNHQGQPLARHIADAVVEYGSLWNISDKDLSVALMEYRVELDLNEEKESEIKKLGGKDKALLKSFEEIGLFDVDENEDWISG